MSLDPGQDETGNEGPHCRNCHTGANSCNQCHENESSAGGAQLGLENKTIYKQSAWVHTNAVAGLNSKCIDGGFSFPHRTLGKDMLKDELYGIDFDGSKVVAGGARHYNGTPNLNNWANPWARSDIDETALATGSGQTYDASKTGTSVTTTLPLSGGTTATITYGDWQNDSIYKSSNVYETGNQLGDGILAENLDSVCIDCHGDATTYNGDNPDKYKGSTGDAGESWELMWKGLP